MSNKVITRPRNKIEYEMPIVGFLSVLGVSVNIPRVGVWE